MDDIDLMSESVSGVQIMLSTCSTALKWAGMDFRYDKSRSIVIIKGKSVITDEESFQPSITSIHAMPIKFLGPIVDGSISDKNSIDEIETKLLEGLFFWYPKTVDITAPANSPDPVASNDLRCLHFLCS